MFAGSRLTLVISALLAAAGAAAQAYPAKAIRIVSPYAPGGTADMLARVVAQKLSEAWGQQVIVDNRPGASGMIGADIAAKAAPDGYTMLMAYVAEIAIVPSLFAKMTYDPVKDLAPVTLAAVTPMIFVVHPSLPVRNVKERFAREGAETAHNSPEQSGKFIQSEITKFARIIRESGARAD